VDDGRGRGLWGCSEGWDCQGKGRKAVKELRCYGPFGFYFVRLYFVLSRYSGVFSEGAGGGVWRLLMFGRLEARMGEYMLLFVLSRIADRSSLSGNGEVYSMGYPKY
jgi:hypothetical protein